MHCVFNYIYCTFINYMLYLLHFICVRIHGKHSCLNTCKNQRTFGSQFSPSIMWVLSIKLSASSLAPSTLAFWAISPPPPSFFSYMVPIQMRLFLITSIFLSHSLLSECPCPLIPFHEAIRIITTQWINDRRQQFIKLAWSWGKHCFLAKSLQSL